MKKNLSRELGIFALISIACGAMVSGLLVLPGYAAGMTGPSVFFAFLLAGALFLPATLSKCEMATALPESGGDYLFIDRSMGPFFSTVSGLGMFFTLTMKSAFALAGFGAYLLVIIPFPDVYAQIAGVMVAAFIIFVNYRGAKKSGTVQKVLFVVTVLSLIWFIGEGSLGVYHDNLAPPMTGGWTGFFSATAFVFVSYAGVTKIASVAEEVKNPGKMIPIGMLTSLGIMVFLYVTVVYVMVGNVPVEKFLKMKEFKDAPLALAGLEIAGTWGMYFLASISALALIAMANAGVLASSRYPFALSRYKQLPDFINRIHPDYATPSVSILITGMILILSITFLPVVQLAKLASAFKLIVLGMLNCALIILRESDIEWYQPEFRSPLYPFVQLFGIFASVFLIFFLGWLSIISSLGLIIFAACWYFLYVRNRVDREGAIFQSANVDAKELKLFQRQRSPSTSSKESVIVPFFDLEGVDPVHIERRLRLAASLCAENERLDVVDFVEIAEQSLLSEYDEENEHLEMLEERARFLRTEIENEIHVDQVITHNSRGALINYARDENPHWVIFDWKNPSPWKILIGARKWWLEDFPCDLLFFKDNGIAQFSDIAVVIEPGPYDGEIIYAAEHIANYFNANITFLNAIDDDDTDQVEFIKTYQDELLKLTNHEANTELISIDNWDEKLIERSHSLDLILMGDRKENSLFKPDKLVSSRTRRNFECNYARIRSNLQMPKSVLYSEDKPKTDVNEFLEKSGIVTEFEASDKSELFDKFSSKVHTDSALKQEILDSLWERENLQNTYVQNGLAFPHGISNRLNETHLLIAPLDPPVSYTESGDKVNLCVVLIGPPDDRQTHLEIIGSLSQKILGDNLMSQLNEASDPVQFLENELLISHNEGSSSDD